MDYSEGPLTQETYIGTQQILDDFEEEVEDVPVPEKSKPWGKLTSLNVDRVDHVNLVDDKEYVIGRSKSSTVICNDAKVSTRHCKVFKEGKDTVFIEDLGSANGTFVNGVKLSKHRRHMLHNNDEIALSVVNNNDFALFVFRSSAQLLLGSRRDPTITSAYTKGVGKLQIQFNNKAQGDRSHSSNVISEDEFSSMYDIRQTLGTGAYGEVKLVVHRGSGCKYAVKIISLNKLNFNGINAKRVDEALKEAELLQTLQHPSITALHEIFQTSTNIYIVMELVTGGELLDRIISKGKYGEEEAKTLVKNVLHAVEYLHKRDVVHRDLKPENILLLSRESDTDIKITDFGLATIVGNEGLKTFCGTPQYFAPEVLKRRNTVMGKGRYGKSADMWSIGVITYILLCGRPPFSDDQLYYQIESGKYDFMDEDWNEISKDAKDFVCNLLRTNPDDRLTVQQALKSRWIKASEVERERVGEGGFKSSIHDTPRSAAGMVQDTPSSACTEKTNVLESSEKVAGVVDSPFSPPANVCAFPNLSLLKAASEKENLVTRRPAPALASANVEVVFQAPVSKSKRARVDDEEAPSERGKEAKRQAIKKVPTTSGRSASTTKATTRPLEAYFHAPVTRSVSKKAADELISLKNTKI